jgi:hypothetical protein
MHERTAGLRDDEEKTRRDDGALEDGQVSARVGFQNQRPEARPLEESLEHDRAAEERSKLCGDDGHNRSDDGG